MRSSVLTKASYCRLLCQWVGRGGHVRPARHLGRHTLSDKTGQINRASSSAASTSMSWEPLPLIHGTNITTVCRTDEHNPCKHDMSHVGLYYKIPHDEYQKYIHEKQFPRYQKQVKSFNECTLMVRQPAIELFNMIDSVNLNYPPMKIMLYGKHGNGKTMTLAHVIHRYAMQDWVIVHVPQVSLWLIHKLYRDIHRSTWKPERVDIPEEAAAWLKLFKEQNSQHLDIETEHSYTWTGQEKTEAGAPLRDLVEFGLNRIRFSSDCIGAVLKELRLAASKKKVKLLVSIDGVNGFWRDTRISIEQQKNIPASMLSIVHNFKKMLEPTWTNGVIVGAICEKSCPVGSREHYMPYYLLGKKGFEVLDPFVPLHVPGYSETEVRSCLDYYTEMKWLQRPKGRTEEGKKELIFLSNKNPGELMQISAQW